MNLLRIAGRWLKKFIYFIWDMLLALIFTLLAICGCFALGVAPMLIGQYTSWHWVSLLTFISGPVALISMFELSDVISDWYEDRQTIGKEIERGI